MWVDGLGCTSSNWKVETIREPSVISLRRPASSLQHLPYLLRGAHLRFVHVDHHHFDDRRAPPVGRAVVEAPIVRAAFDEESTVQTRAVIQAAAGVAGSNRLDGRVRLGCRDGRRRIEKAREIQSGLPFRSSEQSEFPPRFLQRPLGWRIAMSDSLDPAYQEAPDTFNARSASARRAITNANSGGVAMNMARICA